MNVSLFSQIHLPNLCFHFYWASMRQPDCLMVPCQGPLCWKKLILKLHTSSLFSLYLKRRVGENCFNKTFLTPELPSHHNQCWPPHGETINHGEHDSSTLHNRNLLFPLLPSILMSPASLLALQVQDCSGSILLTSLAMRKSKSTMHKSHKTNRCSHLPLILLAGSNWANSFST